MTPPEAALAEAQAKLLKSRDVYDNVLADINEHLIEWSEAFVKADDYIDELEDVIALQAARIRELEAEVAAAEKRAETFEAALVVTATGLRNVRDEHPTQGESIAVDALYDMAKALLPLAAAPASDDGSA